MSLRALLSSVLILASAHVAAAASAVPLVEAARRGDLVAVRTLLQERRADVDEPEPDGTTALHWAAHRGDLGVVDLLLRTGATALRANTFGITPLSLAAAHGSHDVVGRLLKSGADPNTAASGGETVLMTAARAGRTAVVRVLLDAGADVNARESTRGQTALMWAAAQGHADVVRLLATRGADVHAVSRAPASPASVTEGFEISKRTGPRLDTLTAVQFAVRAGHLDAVGALLDAGASPTQLTPQKLDLLSLALVNRRYDVAAFLIERGADVHAASNGVPPLHQLVFSRTPDIGQFPVIQPTGIVTSLDVARMLLARGAEINARTAVRITSAEGGGLAAGATPFLIAAKGADVQMMRFLVANGADVTVVNNRGTNAIAAAAGIEMNNPNQDSGTDADSLEALKMAIALGAGDIDAVNQDGDSAVHGAIFRGTTDNIRLLAERGARLDVKNKRGKLALEDARYGIPGMNNSRRTPRPDAAKLLYELMVARGLNPPAE